MNNRTDFAAIEAFAKVAETGSFRAAAAALAAPSSTVSIQVSRLERRLGTRLVARTTRAVALTDEGRAYFAQIRSALDAVQEADRTFTGRGDAPSGRLRLASPSELGQAVLGRVFAAYARQFPDVAIEVDLRDDLPDPLRDGFDVVLRSAPAPSSSLVARKLGSPKAFRVVGSPAYLARAGTPRHPRDLARHRCLVMGAGQAPVRWPFVRAGIRLSSVPVHAAANSWTVLADLAAAGLGLARVPEYLAGPAIARGDVVAVLEAFQPPPEQLFAVYPRTRQTPARVAGFVEALRGFLAHWPGCLYRSNGVPTPIAQAGL